MFEIDSKVVCIDDSFPGNISEFYDSLPKKGAIYTVRDIVPAQDKKFNEMPAVLLHELKNTPNCHGIEPAFQCRRFRELEDEKIETHELVEVEA